MSNMSMTNRGREKLCKAHAGDIPMAKVKEIAFGSGGVDADRNPLPVTGEEVELKKEQHRMVLEHSYPIPTTCEYLSKLDKNDLPNIYLSELGFFDEEGELITYGTFMEKGKDDDMIFEFHIQEIF